LKIRYLKQFQIDADTEDPLDLSLALASRGVLQASGKGVAPFQSSAWRDTIWRAIEGSEFTSWELPEGSRVPLRSGDGLSAARLADAWRYAVEKTSRTGVRLALKTPSEQTYRGLVAGMLNGQMRRTVMTASSEDDTWIASVITPSKAIATEPTSWPLRIGVYPDDTGLETARHLATSRYVRRGLASVSLLNADEPACDVLIAPHDFRDLRKSLKSRGFTPRAKVILGTTAGLQNDVQRAASLAFLRERVGAAVVATGMPRGDLGQLWLDKFIGSLSHRNTFDVAIWDADRWLDGELGAGRPASTLPWIVADPDFLATTRLDRQMLSLADRIEVLGQDYELEADTASRLKVDARVYGSSDLAGLLRQRTDPVYFRYEGDAATGYAELSNETAAREARAVNVAVGSGGAPPKQAPLYADVTFFDSDTDHRVDDTLEALEMGREYVLEVTLRAVPQGISHRGQTPRLPVAPVDTADSTSLLVVVSTSDTDFEIPEQVKRLRLSATPGTQLEPVYFNLTPKRCTATSTDLLELEVRIYYELNLLEYLEVKAEVVRHKSEAPQLDLPVPIFVEQRIGAARTLAELGAGLAPQRLAIDIGRVGDRARFSFTLDPPADAESPSVVLHGQQEISLAALRLALNRLRGHWEEISVKAFANAVQGRRADFAEALKTLAATGQELWSLLFNSGSQDGSMWAIGRWLKENRPADGAAIDVRLRDGAESFVFPWSSLFDADAGRDDDLSGFWGLRYSIGQSTRAWSSSTTLPLGASTGPSRMEFMTWNAFANMGDQVAMLDALANASEGRFAVDTKAPVRNQRQFTQMLEECEADILYFYTHGFTRPAEADAAFDPIDRIRKAYQALPSDEQETSGLKSLYDLVTSDEYDIDESWIRLSGGRLFLRELMPIDEVDLRRRPVVILNMCASAQVMPGLQYSFVQFFLHRRARCVIGTECPISTVFAHPFSEVLLREFLAGRTLGEALRRARVHFMRERNPLGLAYTLYGAAGACFAAPVLPPSPPAPNPVSSQPEPEHARHP
jgi:hypothetical protein